jgi:hypothetical protein
LPDRSRKLDTRAGFFSPSLDGGLTLLADEDKRRRLALPLEPAQGPEFVTAQRMGAGRAVLDPPHMQDGAIEVDLVPTQVAGLSGAPLILRRGSRY